MKPVLLVVVFAASVLFIAVAAPAEECTVHWVYPDQPPLFVSKGYGAGHGTVQRSQEFFVRYMKGCKHTFSSANVERLVTIIRQSDDACSAAFYPTPERRQFIEFSIPVRITLSNAVIIDISRKKEFSSVIDSKGNISLEGMLKKGFRIGVAKGRVYRGIIDEVLKKHRGNPLIIEHPSADDTVGKLIQMMQAGRVDAIIGYPFEAHYALKTTKAPVKLISIHVAGMDEYGLSYAGCSKTEKGKEIIRRLNAIILKYRNTPEFLGFVEYWLDPEAKKRFRKYSQKEFQK